MKHLIKIGAVVLAINLQSCSQKNSNLAPPEKVLIAFNEKFYGATEVEWEMENEKEWEAEFKINGTKFSANFSTNGTWEESEFEIDQAEISDSILSILNQNFKDFNIEKVEITETPSGKAHEFKIEIGEDDFKVIIDSKGNLNTKKIIEKDQENDED